MTERKTKMVPLGELTLMDRFLFDAAMENEGYTGRCLRLF